MEDKHFCYILYNSVNSQTYNGYTNNLKRRIRQHNGEIKGGALFTTKFRAKGVVWQYLAIIECPEFTKHTALSCEWHIRYPTCKKPRPPIYKGAEGRLKSLPLVCNHDKFNEYNFTIYITDELLDKIPNIEKINFKPLSECSFLL